MNKLKLTIIIPLLAAVFVFPALLLSNVSALDEATTNAACEGLGLVGENCEETEAGAEVNNLVADVVNIFSWIVGVVAVIMIIVAGFKYITAHGDSNAISSAKTTLTYAIVGLVIAVSAQAIVQFVLKEVTEADQTTSSEQVDCNGSGPC